MALGGVIVDGGRFDWQASGRFPQFCAPDPAYHGLSFCKAAGAAAFAVRARAILLRDLGACLAPLHAFLLLQGLETLSLRVDRHVENALAVVDFLAGHPRVERVNHPSLPGSPSYNLYHRYFPKGGGSIFTFEVKGDAAAARACIDRLRVFSLLANVADAKSLVIHPASTTHAQMTAAEPRQRQASCPIRYGFPSALSTRTICWRIWTRPCAAYSALRPEMLRILPYFCRGRPHKQSAPGRPHKSIVFCRGIAYKKPALRSGLLAPSRGPVLQTIFVGGGHHGQIFRSGSAFTASGRVCVR